MKISAEIESGNIYRLKMKISGLGARAGRSIGVRVGGREAFFCCFAVEGEDVGVFCVDVNDSIAKFLISLNPGDQAFVRLTADAVVLPATDKPLTLVAKDLGIVPVLAMIKNLHTTSDFRLVWAVDRLCLADQLQAVQQMSACDRIFLVFPQDPQYPEYAESRVGYIEDHLADVVKGSLVVVGSSTFCNSIANEATSKLNLTPDSIFKAYY